MRPEITWVTSVQHMRAGTLLLMMRGVRMIAGIVMGIEWGRFALYCL